MCLNDTGWGVPYGKDWAFSCVKFKLAIKGGSIPMRNSEMGSDFTDSTLFLPDGSCVLWSHMVYDPTMTNKSGTTANGVVMHHGSEPLQKTSYGTGMGSNGSVLVESHVKALANDMAFSSKYRCNLCNIEFLNYSFYGRHICCHARAEKVERSLTSQNMSHA